MKFTTVADPSEEILLVAPGKCTIGHPGKVPPTSMEPFAFFIKFSVVAAFCRICVHHCSLGPRF